MKNIIIILLLALSVNLANTLYAQTPTGDQKIYVKQTIEYLKRLSSISVMWTNNPENKDLRKEMVDLVKSYSEIKKNISFVLIVVGSESDRKSLTGLLDSYESDRNELVRQLLLWKYQINPVEGMDILRQLDEINEASKAILSNLQNDENLDDAVSVLLSQDEAENRITPLSKDTIDKLVKLKIN
ncbi:MAG: hypothetical protein QY309_02415 [Cyclobacteriaceae bacterium]|nr:MAG: hypothetical protein QY309_02415 [Cyclobacteriaceae bacterium]